MGANLDVLLIERCDQGDAAALLVLMKEYKITLEAPGASLAYGEYENSSNEWRAEAEGIVSTGKTAFEAVSKRIRGLKLD